MLTKNIQGVILVIDDNVTNIKVIVDCLKAGDFTVIIAKNGEMGRQRAKFAQPDLILLDILMPEVDGFEICRQLKADSATREIPIIFMTALSSIEDKVKGFSLGAVDYITKPIQEEEVLARVRTHINLRRLTVLEERQRLSRELHDSVTQSLYSLMLLTNGWGMMAEQGRFEVEKTESAFAQLGNIAKQALKEMRLLIHQLRPDILNERGLVGALQNRLDTVERRANVDSHLLTTGDLENLRPKVSEQLFFIVQEALNNALRHAHATTISIVLDNSPPRLTLTITDDGVGFDVTAPSVGLGLVSMRERAAIINGEIDITSTRQQGTIVKVIVHQSSQIT